MLDSPFGMCPLHSEVVEALFILLKPRLFPEIHSGGILSTIMCLITKPNTASAWHIFLIVLHEESVTKMAHAVLAQKPGILSFICDFTELSRQW